MLVALFLLLPVAAYSGWYIANKQYKNSPKKFVSDEVSNQYFSGLNYLLNEQPDKAVDIFVQLLDVDDRVVEIHLALGNLFRRQGEVDRAIRIHENLIARPNLSKSQRMVSLLELSRDYVHAGVWDRAEELLLELVEMKEQVEPSLNHLLDIYQQSKDWHCAIETAHKLQKYTGKDYGLQIANFHCELASIAIKKGEIDGARIEIENAFKVNPKCVRASLLRADLQVKSGEYHQAIKSYKNVEKQDQSFLSEVIVPLTKCYQGIGNAEGMIDYLKECIKDHPAISVVLALSNWISKTAGDKEAISFITEYLHKRPSIRGLNKLVQLNIDTSNDNESNKNLKLFKELIEKILSERPVYRCDSCGYSSKILSWRCPGCCKWEVIKPIHGLEGE